MSFLQNVLEHVILVSSHAVPNTHHPNNQNCLICKHRQEIPVESQNPNLGLSQPVPTNGTELKTFTLVQEAEPSNISTALARQWRLLMFTHRYKETELDSEGITCADVTVFLGAGVHESARRNALRPAQEHNLLIFVGGSSWQTQKNMCPVVTVSSTNAFHTLLKALETNQMILKSDAKIFAEYGSGLQLHLPVATIYNAHVVLLGTQ